MAAKNGGKFFFMKSPVDSADTMQVKYFVKSLYLALLSRQICFMQKFKMAAKMVEKLFLEKVASRLCRYPAAQKFCRNLVPFPR